MITLLSLVPEYVASHAIEVVWVTWLIAAVGSLVTVLEARDSGNSDCIEGTAGCH